MDLAWLSSSSTGQLIVTSAADERMSASRDWLASREWRMWYPALRRSHRRSATDDSLAFLSLACDHHLGDGMEGHDEEDWYGEIEHDRDERET